MHADFQGRDAKSWDGRKSLHTTKFAVDLLRGKCGKTGVKEKTCYGQAAELLQACSGKVANLLQTKYGEAGVKYFGLNAVKKFVAFVQGFAATLLTRGSAPRPGCRRSRRWLAYSPISAMIYKKLQTIYLMLYKRQLKNCKNQKYKHERIH